MRKTVEKDRRRETETKRETGTERGQASEREMLRKRDWLNRFGYKRLSGSSEYLLDKTKSSGLFQKPQWGYMKEHQ